MKNKRFIAMLAALALFCCTLAWGDYNVLNKGTHYLNAATGARVDATGNAYNNEAFKDRDNYQVVPVCADTISNAGLVGTAWALSNTAFSFCAESSAVIPCYMYRRFTLMVRIIPAGGDTTTVTRLAIQIRSHTDATNDSSSTFAWSEWTGNAAGAADSLAVGSAASGNGALALNNERIFSFPNGRGRGGLHFGQNWGSWPDGIAVDLKDKSGQWFWGPYVSVRIRYIGGATTAATLPKIVSVLAMGS